MTIDRIISLISTVSLVYFAYGTWRIDRTLTKVERHLAHMRKIAHDNFEADKQPSQQL